MSLSVFTSANHPYQPAQFPPFHVFHTPCHTHLTHHTNCTMAHTTREMYLGFEAVAKSMLRDDGLAYECFEFASNGIMTRRHKLGEE